MFNIIKVSRAVLKKSILAICEQLLRQGRIIGLPVGTSYFSLIHPSLIGIGTMHKAHDGIFT